MKNTSTLFLSLLVAVLTVLLATVSYYQLSLIKEEKNSFQLRLKEIESAMEELKQDRMTLKKELQSLREENESLARSLASTTAAADQARESYEAQQETQVANDPAPEPEPEPPVEIVSDHSGDRYCFGDKVGIQWRHQDDVETVMIGIGVKGMSWTNLGTYPADDGVLVWEVGDVLPGVRLIERTTYKFIIQDMDSRELSDWSDGHFSISECY